MDRQIPTLMLSVIGNRPTVQCNIELKKNGSSLEFNLFSNGSLQKASYMNSVTPKRTIRFLNCFWMNKFILHAILFFLNERGNHSKYWYVCKYNNAGDIPLELSESKKYIYRGFTL